MNLINLTPHAIVLNEGSTIPPSGTVARVQTTFVPITPLLFRPVPSEVVGLPPPQHDTLFIVSAMVAQAVRRPDVVSPATGHPDCVRDSHGQIVSVPGFVQWT